MLDRRAFLLALDAAAKNAVFKRAGHVHRHAVFQTFFANDDLLLEKFVRDEVFGPANETGDSALNAGVGGDRALRSAEIGT